MLDYNQKKRGARMKIDLKDIVLIFQKMQEELNISNVSIVIFVAVDVDSICTLKIITKMLKCENIHYKAYPVTTYSDLGTRIEQAKVYDKVKMFLFINCGGIIDLTEYWIVQQKQAQIFLFDINKPINHKNLESQEIKIIDDGFGQLQHCPTSQEIERYQELNEYDLDDDDDDEDEEVSRAEDSPKRMKKRDFKEKLRKHKELIETKIAKYYNNNFFGYPSSYSAYRMIRDLERHNNEYLWYAIVGATSLFLQQKISKDILDAITQLYRQDAGKFNSNELKREKGGISVRKGYQFTLLEHWSLYQSMLHSPYLMIKLHLWDPKGVNKLHQFIHYLEISLNEANQLFKYMTKQAQNKLENNIIPIAEKFGLHEVVYTSFLKQVDYSDSYTPADYHYVLTSVLEAPPKNQLNMTGLGEHRVNCFWQAYELFEASQKTLNQYIESYKRIVKILIKQTRNLLERDHLIRMDQFSLVSLKNDTDDRKIFQHPSTLIRLANLLMGVQWEKDKHRKQRKEKGPLPVIASWIDLEREVSLVVGVNLQSKNNLGNRFNEVAQRLKIQVNHDSFLANIIMMKKESIGQFLREMGRTRD